MVSIEQGRKRMIRAVPVIAALSLALFIPATPAFAEPGDEITTGSEETEAALRQVEANLAAAQAKMTELGHKIEEAGEDLAETEEALAQTIADIEATIKEIEVKQGELAEAQNVLGDRVASNYRTGNLSFLEVILSAEDFNDFISRVHYMDKISAQDAEIIGNVKSIKAALEEKQATLDARKQEEQALLEQQKAEKERLESALDEQEAIYNSLGQKERELLAKQAAEIEAKKEAARQAALEEARRLAAEQAAREAAEREAAAAANRSSGSSSSSSSSNSSSGGNSNYVGKSSPNIVNNAMNYLGRPYVWGATGPSTFDCSGLTQRAYREAGISIPRTSRSQYASARAKGNLTYDMGSLAPGDLVWFGRGGRIHHVGVYIGGGQMVHAPSRGQVVRVQPVNAVSGFAGGGRP